MALPVKVERGRSFDPLELVRSDLSLLNRVFGLGRNLFDDAGDGSALNSIGNYGVDIREDKDHIYIEADLPGFRKEEVNVSMEEGVLTISAEHVEEAAKPAQPGQQQPAPQQQRQENQPQQDQEQQQQRGRGNYLLRERRVQRFIRSFTLPPNIDEKQVQAKLEDGVLKITLNKREDTKPKRIEVA
jgi:HSP20 family protein